MSRPKYKIGDRVVCIDSPALGEQFRHQTGTIKEIEHDRMAYQVDFDNVPRPRTQMFWSVAEDLMLLWIDVSDPQEIEVYLEAQ